MDRLLEIRKNTDFICILMGKNCKMRSSTQSTIAEMTWKKGGFIIFWGNKNGAMMAEALVIFNRKLSEIINAEKPVI